ncbi:MAG: hypothetical protein KF834_08550 [Burkholderiales bacterium]|nr:hypothetical protein [Burkholderiales bacterium]
MPPQVHLRARSGGGEWYDLVADPDEMHNRFAGPAFTKVRRALEELMHAKPGGMRDDLATLIGMT